MKTFTKQYIDDLMDGFTSRRWYLTLNQNGKYDEEFDDMVNKGLIEKEMGPVGMMYRRAKQ